MSVAAFRLCASIEALVHKENQGKEVVGAGLGALAFGNLPQLFPKLLGSSYLNIFKIY